MSQVEAFYVGYQPSAPYQIRRRMLRTVAILGAGCIGFAAFLVLAQAPFAASRFEFGQYRAYEGELVEWPYPMLLTPDGHYLLVGTGKFGVSGLLHGRDGQGARLRGSLIERDGQRMLEVEPASLQFAPLDKRSKHLSGDLGKVTLTGEIVDTKCYLGVMNPGSGKVHRGCAVRCISGGAPPAFLVRDAAGETHLLLLVGSDGRQLSREVLDYVAEPVTISGLLTRRGESLILKAEPKHFRRE